MLKTKLYNSSSSSRKSAIVAPLTKPDGINLIEYEDPSFKHIVKRMYLEFETPFRRTRYDIENKKMYGYYLHGNVIAVVTLEDNIYHFEIKNIFVSTEYRRMGFGTKLIQYIIKLIGDRKAIIVSPNHLVFWFSRFNFNKSSYPKLDIFFSAKCRSSDNILFYNFN